MAGGSGEAEEEALRASALRQSEGGLREMALKKKLGAGKVLCTRDPHGCWLACLHPGGNPGENLESISHRCYLFEVAFVWELTKQTIVLPLGCLQGGVWPRRRARVWTPNRICRGIVCGLRTRI